MMNSMLSSQLLFAAADGVSDGGDDVGIGRIVDNISCFINATLLPNASRSELSSR